MKNRKILRRFGYERRRMVEGMTFVSIWVIGFVLFMIYPLFYSLTISFTHSTLKDIFGGPFIGWDNYRSVVSSPQFATIFVKTLLNALLDIPTIVLFSLLCAVLLHRPMVGRVYFRAVFFVPVIIAGVVMRLLFEQNAADFSIFGKLAGGMLVVSDMIGSDLFDRIGVLMWRSSVETLIFLAGLQGIPRSQYEAAHIDGATVWESFWLITIPYLSPIILLNLIYATIDSFTEPLNPIIEYLKLLVFNHFNFGIAAAMSWMYFLVILVIVLIMIAVGRRYVYYGSDPR
ncbi:carbohydrate ABC transporter permease [Paenibacillus eucommiae]|uniref:ABC-type sugar transport system permease subunit n=1 Tax=Paenibacillus eucommiae TaxID=1355755 RepID=A0ABS4IVX8_9BACL|nr:sugar ABC transporter permease [Paenibacillus eucommiae]MBP1991745.1 ABC-type sugar transport system permease subunit [Paenibacillus eucommiae]